MNDENLWEKWKAHYAKIGVPPKTICRDGIIDFETYSNSKRKILFVLKDVNDWPEGDLRVMLQNGPVYQMWHTIARWSAGLLQGFPPYEQVDRFDVMKESLRSIAAINLKKCSGKAWSDSPVVNAFAFRDRDLLLEQIHLIAPEVIVAGGTFDPLIWLLELNVDPEHPLSKVVVDQKSGIKVVPWRHPGRVNNRQTYQQLKKIFQTA